MTELRVWRVGEKDRETAFQLVEEYNDAVDVALRDSAESFQHDYFRSGSGFWLAESQSQSGSQVVGCIALRPLRTREQAGEIKRLYVRPEFRGSGAALALLVALEQYAEASGYEWLYLDSKDDLKAARRFYDRHGYEACERYNRNQQATVFLRKALHPRAEPRAESRAERQWQKAETG
jgi:ribosomal protein S18 acetylase RimI-like enzyme